MPSFEAYLKVLHPIHQDGERILWRDLASRRGLRFHQELNPELLRIPMPGLEFVDDLIGPLEGDLDDSTCRELANAIEQFTGSQACLFEFGVLQLLDDPILYRGPLPGVTSCKVDLRMRDYPERWWPQDNSWYVYTDYDLPYTLFGGSKEMANGLKARQTLECIDVDAATRTRYAVDTENLDICWRQAAEAILSGYWSLWRAAKVTAIIQYATRNHSNPLSETVERYYSAVANYPHGHERDQWDPTALAAKDKEREAIDAHHRERVLEACRTIL